MKAWLKKFWNIHGDRVVYGVIATVFGVAFILMGKYMELTTFSGAGETILIGVGMYSYKCMQGNKDTSSNPSPSGNPTNTGTKVS